MEYRRYLQKGTVIQAEDGQIFRILRPASGGGTALTYYGEELSPGRVDLHGGPNGKQDWEQEPVPVYLKELYPKEEGYFRQENGAVKGTESFDGQAELLVLEREFLREQKVGNQILKEGVSGVYPVTKIVRDRMTGNLYGVFYSCPPSMSLRAFTEEGCQLSLAGKIRTVLELCRVVKGLHKKGGFCHRDISPGNVLLLGAFTGEAETVGRVRFPGAAELCERNPQVGLIDFACAGKIGSQADEDGMEDMALWVTDGFGAPERFDSGPCEAAADVYSVTACLWYFITGEAPFDGVNREVLFQCLKRHRPVRLGGEFGLASEKTPGKISESVFLRLAQVMERGLEEKERRYGSIELLERKLSEVLALIEGEAVSEEELQKTAWEQYRRVRTEGRLRYAIDSGLLPSGREKRREGKGKTPSLPLVQTLSQSAGSFFVIGEGGGGKTTSVLAALDMLETYHVSVIPVYLELNRLPADGGGQFLERYLAGLFKGIPGGLSEPEDPAAAAFSRRFFMKPADGIPRYLAVLDGLNEMVFSDSQAKGEFLETVNDYLSRAQNLRLILTGRQDEKRIRAEKLKRFYVEDLSDETVKKALVQPLGQPEEQTDFSRNCQALWKVLHIPFFLSVYQSLSNRGEIKNAGELLEQYFFERAESVSGAGDYGERNLSEEKYRDKYYAKGVTVQAVRRFVLQTMLPELGLFMAEQGRFFLREEEALSVLEKSVQNAALADRAGSRLCRVLGSGSDFSVLAEHIQKAGMEKCLEILTEQLGILVKSAADTVSFLHQHYRDYFAASAVVNRLKAITLLSPETAADLFHQSFDRQVWDSSVLRFAGEILGLSGETPVFDGTRWERGFNENPAMERMLRLLKRSSRFYSQLQILRRSCGEEFNSWNAGEANLFGMYQACCQGTGTGGRPDLSGLDLSDMDLSSSGIERAVFSRQVPGVSEIESRRRGIYADLTDTDLGLGERLRLPEDPMIGRAVCHPSEPVLLVSRETLGGVWYLEEWNQADDTKKLYGTCSPFATFGYSASGTYIWQEDLEESGELRITERETGRFGSTVWKEEQVLFAGPLSGERLGLVLLDDKNRLSAVFLPLKEAAYGQFQAERISVAQGWMPETDGSSLQFDMADERNVLAGTGREIWRLTSDGCRRLFSLDEEEGKQGKFLFASDRSGKAVYIFLKGEKGTGRCICLDPVTGEKTGERFLSDCDGSGLFYVPEWACGRAEENFLPDKETGWNGFMEAAGRQVMIAYESGFTNKGGWKGTGEEKGKLALWTFTPGAERQSYQWMDEAEGKIRRISLGETIAAVYKQKYDDGPLGGEYSLQVLSTLDGEVYAEWGRNRKSDRFMGKSARISFCGAGLSKAGGQKWLTVMDPVLHMAVFMEQTGSRSFRMGGFCFPEPCPDPVLAVYTDWETRLVYTFDGTCIQAFSADTGEEDAEKRQLFADARSQKHSLYEKRMAALFRHQTEILKAVFTEDGERIVMKICYPGRSGDDSQTEEIWEWELESGSLRKTQEEEIKMELWDVPGAYFAADMVYQSLGWLGFTAGCPGSGGWDYE